MKETVESIYTWATDGVGRFPGYYFEEIRKYEPLPGVKTLRKSGGVFSKQHVELGSEVDVFNKLVNHWIPETAYRSEVPQSERTRYLPCLSILLAIAYTTKTYTITYIIKYTISYNII